MRKHLARDFDAIYVLDLGGNVRKNPKLLRHDYTMSSEFKSG